MLAIESDIELGATYEDAITGFVGIACALVIYFTGCHQVMLRPRIGKDKKIPDAEWMDVDRLRRVGDNVVELAGFPQDIVRRRAVRRIGPDSPPPSR